MDDDRAVILEDIGQGQSSGYQIDRENRISIRNRPSRQENGQSDFSQLPPADGGKQAWLFLAGCFFVEALVWGFPFAFGVFQDYYSNHEPFKGSKHIASIGTTALGIMYLGCPFTFALLQRYPKSRRFAGAAGLGIMCIALVAASFSQTVVHLILTQGVLYAIGSSLIYAPAVLFMDEWFSRRKGFAFGVMWAGTGLAGIILPIIMERGLAQYGFRTMVRSYAVALFILAGPLLYYVKPRIPPAMASHSRRVDLGFLKSPTFLVFQTGNIIEGLGYFMPSIYLPTYARSLGLSQFSGTLTVVLFNTTSVVGCLLMGAMTDKYHVTTCIIASTVGTMLSVFLFWGLSLSMAFLTIFALTYGLFAGCYTSTFPGILREIQTRDPRAPTGMVFAMLAAGRGVGSVVSGPLSEVLIRGSSAKVDSFYSENFRGLIIFTGVTAALGGFSWAGKRVGWI